MSKGSLKQINYFRTEDDDMKALWQNYDFIYKLVVDRLRRDDINHGDTDDFYYLPRIRMQIDKVVSDVLNLEWCFTQGIYGTRDGNTRSHLIEAAVYKHFKNDFDILISNWNYNK